MREKIIEVPISYNGREYKEGKKGLIGLFMGEVMNLSKGKADPKLCNQMLKEILQGKPSLQEQLLILFTMET